MISIYLLLLLPTLTFAGLEIIDSPGDFTWVEQGGEKTFVCTTNIEWQWCEWSHTNADDEEIKYQIGQSSSEIQTKDPLISFTEKSETTCGIKISNADRVQHEVSNTQLDLDRIAVSHETKLSFKSYFVAYFNL